jgi:hypothetical protein
VPAKKPTDVNKPTRAKQPPKPDPAAAEFGLP